MSNFISTIRCQPRRAIIISAGIGVSVLALQYLWRRFFSSRRGRNLLSFRSSLFKLSERCEIDISSFHSAIDCLEALLIELEPQRFNSDLVRGRYDLIASIVARLRGICSDLQRYVSEDFSKKASTDDIARTLWSERIVQNLSQRAGTLSVFSDDSFATAYDDLDLEDNSRDINSNASLSIDIDNLEFYTEGLKAAREYKVKYRVSRAEFCKCESEQDFAAKLYCLRKAFRNIMNNDHKMNFLIQSGRVLVADLLRHSGREVTTFYIAYDRMMEFLTKEENRQAIMEELHPRKVEELNLWDVLFDFVIIDAFEDLRKPPSSITALIKNSWLGYSMKEAAVNNIVWSLIKVKRSRLQYTDGFITRFYDISHILTTPLTLGLLGGSPPEFEEICIFFKDCLLSFVVDIFNFDRVRYTSIEDLTEDVEKLLIERVELMKVKISNELLPV